ncbi:MAG: ATPase [Microbacterium sp.]|nr:ATPase [Microbacterium sp.]
MSTEHTIAAVDLGKTRCRVATADAGVRTGVGAPGLAAPHGVERAVEAILPLLALVGAPTLLGVGAAGAWAAPDAAQELADRLTAATGARTAVASDVVTAHAGALAGAPGVLLIAGTGAAALGADADGIRLVDGWGPDIGDLGSGSWLGREAVRAVQRAAARLGPATVLSDVVRAHIAPTSDPIAWTAQQEPLARALGAFAPAVLDAAAEGDEVSLGIAREAVRLLTASAVAASATTTEVALHGGLIDHSWFRAALGAALADAGRTVVPSAGDALDGAVLLARRADLLHERFVHRAE